ncbi:AAA family ATPase [Lentibacillus cibarius]|uniref:Protein CR006 P-loop domain-containing protein n=1 Tax=Lentibacillus cibarius TaxID=2583219 RepID=A0A5S3QL81_9BACI|nr:AAA family ATPase [Lentibacillus cibarius]TMN22692.1 hypothetical protein FFL34_11740 [Lentibacillus cibarius]
MDVSTKEWLVNRPKWIQLAAKQLLESGEPSDNMILELTRLCKQEVNNEFPNIDIDIPESVFSSHNSENIRLCSISETSGINKLAPKTPLEFGEGDIVVVYGHNGSGKSGYVRLLKHVCGARNKILGELHNNVFTQEKTDQEAKITFLKNNVPKTYEWTGQGVCDELNSVNIFDDTFGQVFIGGEDEVSYEPPILSFFSSLIEICKKVEIKLNEEEGALKSKIPKIPNELMGSEGAKWIGDISAGTTSEEIEKYCAFTKENEEKLQEIQKRLLEPSPEDKVKQLKNQNKNVDNLIREVQKHLDELSYENCKRIIAAKKKEVSKRSAAETAASKAFSDSELEGIGSDVWKEMWNAARKYSNEYAWKDKNFPVIEDNSVCVLCHQPLSVEAKKRFMSFEEYIKGETQSQAEKAENEKKLHIDALSEIPDSDTLKAKANASGIEKQEVIDAMIETFTMLRKIKGQLQSSDINEDIIAISQNPDWLERMRDISKEYQSLANKYTEDYKQDNREELKQILQNLKAKKWLSNYKQEIFEEVNRLQALQKIKEAKRTTSSTALSKKKGELAETFITDAFIQRFNNELSALGASHLKVRIVKSKVSKGSVLHTIKLDGVTQKNINEILSEGEKRIVSIAAFIADVTGSNNSGPFVIDDPISSLDQNYEEAVVQRLCNLSSNEQVIIFTHRLSFLGLVQDFAKKKNVKPETVAIREESWGTGEPGDIPIFAKKPDRVLNKLIGEILSKAKKIYNEHGRESYEPYGKSLCSEFRILIERMIEHELMSNVVQRYKRDINTQGKIDELAKISEADCNYFDQLMTKYSRYEHSQPLEAPVSIPDPYELENDFCGLREWHTEFKNRQLSVKTQ